LLAAVAAISSGCSIHADFGSTSFRCDVVERCPGDQVCLDGICRAGGSEPDAAPVDPFLSPWTATTPIPEARDYLPQHAATVNGFIYLVGGYGPSLAEVATVELARANADGTLGNWSETKPLPAPRALSDVVASDGVLYVVGGANGGVAQSSVYYAPVAGDGTVAGWTATTALPGPRKSHVCMVASGRVYAIGGGDDTNERLASAYVARIEEGGALGAWQPTTPLPEPRANMSAVAVNGTIYVIGGDGADEQPVATVYHAAIDPDSGMLGTWTSAPDLPAARRSGTAATAAGYLYLMGGTGDVAVAEVLHARIEADGTGAWEIDTGLPAPRFRHTAAATDGFFYVIGGTTGADVLYAETPDR
jgi:hypothetical protein